MVDWFRLGYAVAYVAFAVGAASSVARFYSRGLVVRLWGWDDSAACVVFVVSIVHQVVLQMFLSLGCGKPGNEECGFRSLGLLKTAFIEEIVIYAAHCVIKMTFLLFYLRLSLHNPFRRFVYIGMGLNCAVFISSLLMTVLQCIPFDKILNPALHPEVTCLNARIVMLTPPVLNIAMDFYILCLPITVVWSLQMTVRRKFTILSVLAFGLVSVTVAILRLPVLISVTSMQTDVSIDVGKMIVVAAFEVQCAIVAVNLPALSSLLTKLKGREDFAYEQVSQAQQNPVPEREREMERGKSKTKTVLSFTTRVQRGLLGNESDDEFFEPGTVQKKIKMGRPRKHALKKKESKDIELVQQAGPAATNRRSPKRDSGHVGSREDQSGGRDNASTSGME